MAANSGWDTLVVDLDPEGPAYPGDVSLKQLVEEGVLQPGEPDKIVDDFHAHLESQYEAAANYKPGIN